MRERITETVQEMSARVAGKRASCYRPAERATNAEPAADASPSNRVAAACRPTIRRAAAVAVLALVVHAGALAEPAVGRARATTTLSLDEAVARAASQSPEVLRAEAAAQSAGADVSSALVPFHAKMSATANGAATYGTDGLAGSSGGTLRFQPAPSVTLSAEANATSTNSAVTTAGTQTPAFSVGGAWDALPPHRLSEDALTLDSANADRAGAGEVLALARIQAGLKARHDYRLLQIDVARSAIAREAATAARAALERDEANARANAISRADLLKSKRDDADARLSLKQAMDAEAVDRRALARDTGVTQGEITPTPWSGIDFAPVTFDEATLRDIAARGDPTVLAAGRRLALAQTRLASARQRNNLSVTLQAGVEWQKPSSSPVVTAGVQGSYDIVDGGRLTAAVDKARSEVAAARVALDAAEASLLDTLRRQIDQLEEKALEIEGLRYARDRARVLYVDGQSRAKAGAITADELAAAKRTYAGAELDLDAAVVDYEYLADSVRKAPGDKPL